METPFDYFFTDRTKQAMWIDRLIEVDRSIEASLGAAHLLVETKLETGFRQ